MLSRSHTFLALIAIAAVYMVSAGIDVMEIDAAQYASIAREMLERGEYLQVTNRYEDYLDKPPLLFWLSALSFSLIGISNFAFKLPSLLFALLGIYSTYRLGTMFYSRATGRLAAVMFASTQAMFLITNDVRTDTMLTGAIIFSIWNLAAFDSHRKWSSLLLAALGIAAGMLAKGPIGIMAPALAMGAHFAVRREWRSIFRWQWAVVLVVVALPLSPMLWGLYQQFDQQPDKNVSGVRFFLWDQSFGRLTGDNPFINSQINPPPNDPFFLVHTVLWAFLPWSVLFLSAMWERSKRLIQSRFAADSLHEAITFGGFILVLIGMSLSDYKLPHYIFIAFPLAAIITADHIERLLRDDLHSRLGSVLSTLQLGVSGLLWTAVVGLCAFSFPMHGAWNWAFLTAAFAVSMLLMIRKPSGASRLIHIPLITIIAVNLTLSAHVYPQLMTYQSASDAGRLMTGMQVKTDQFASYRIGGHSLDFYAQRAVPWLSEPGAVALRTQRDDTWVYTDEEGMHGLAAYGLVADSVITYADFRVTMLSLQFLVPEKREKLVRKRYLLRFKAQ